MPVQTLQQKRAAYALERVQHWAEALNDNDAEKKKFKSRAKDLPFMIHSGGLGQALAFFKSQGAADGYNYLYEILDRWLIKDEQPFHGHPDALIGVAASDISVYLAAQVEAMMLMDWVKKFADAFMGSEAR